MVNLADGDITQGEVKPDVVKWSLDTVRFLVVTKTCEVTYRKVDGTGEIVPGAGEEKVIFMDRPNDDPATTEFTDLITAINSGSNIKNTITDAVKTKLSI